MDIQDYLRANHEALLEQYHTNLDNVKSLQTTLLRDIVPSVKDELQLDPDTSEWTTEWLYDTFTLFRILRRNNFTSSFALEATRKNIVWRLTNLRKPVEYTTSTFLRCLPSNVSDRFGHPIIVVKLAFVNQTSDAIKLSILQAFEMLRINLKRLNDKSDGNLTLQYIVLLDVEGILLKNINVELVTWTLREVISYYPGMLAGAFILNYSWTHSGLWVIAKRLLPASAVSRLFFPTRQELLQYFTPSALPEDYGGTLPILTRLEDSLWFHNPPLRVQDVILEQTKVWTSAEDKATATASLSSTSSLNPFFGYPVSQASGTTILPHGRRRKRDLAETLALLFWVRWRKRISFALVIATLLFALRIRYPRGIPGYTGIFR